VGFESTTLVFERAKTVHALDLAATIIVGDDDNNTNNNNNNNNLQGSCLFSWSAHRHEGIFFLVFLDQVFLLPVSSLMASSLNVTAIFSPKFSYVKFMFQSDEIFCTPKLTCKKVGEIFCEEGTFCIQDLQVSLADRFSDLFPVTVYSAMCLDTGEPLCTSTCGQAIQ
jgi:hypothetical protein